MKNKFIHELDVHKEGIFIGAVVGAAAAWYAVSQGADLNTIAQAGKAALDNLMTRSAPLDIAATKVYVAFISLGAVMGYIIDKIITRK